MIANNKIISKLRQEPLTTYGNECVEINAMSLNYHRAIGIHRIENKTTRIEKSA